IAAGDGLVAKESTLGDDNNRHCCSAVGTDCTAIGNPCLEIAILKNAAVPTDGAVAFESAARERCISGTIDCAARTLTTIKPAETLIAGEGRVHDLERRTRSR